MDKKYSTKNISANLIHQIVESLKSINGWGSIEIFIQNYSVTQITEKNIKKPINARLNK